MKTTYLGSVRNLFAYLIFSCVGLFSAATLSAQSAGWEALLANDFMAARQAFDESLQKDSTQREELLGALFLADIFKDTERYQRLGKKLLYSHPEPILWRAFRNALPGEALYTDWFESLNPDQKAYGPIRMYASLAKLDETNRKDRSKARKKRLTYEEGTALLMPLLQKDGWAILGPFQNIGGGGLEKVYPPETDGYDPQASYTNAHDLPLQWFSPPFPTLRTGLEFSSVLPGGKHMSTYYARKAFEMEQAGQLDLAITRNNPMKVWINGTLVFSTDEPMGFYADGETINLDLEKGQYEILVKMARKENWYGSARGLFALRYSAPTYGDESSIFMLRALETGGSEKALKPIPGKLNNPGNLKSFSVVEEGLLSANLARLGEGEFAWSEYYLLVRLANRMGKTRVVEEAMVALQKEHPDQVYLQLLLASVYQQNLNRNMAIRMVSQIDLEKTPHYDLLMKELEEVDEDLQEDEYEEKMDQIKAIAPSNRDFVQSYLRYYRGKKDSTTLYAFRDETLTAYPEMAYLFDEEDGEEFVNKGKKKKNKKEKKPQYNQDKKKKWFEEALEYRPFSRNLYQEKVEELLEEKEYETAAKIAQQGLKVSPYDPKLWELLGDTQEGLSQTDSALNCFRRSMQYRSAAGRNYYYGSNPLKKKIERLGEKNEATDFFQKKTLADILAERDLWEETYKDQDAVILLRTADYLINEYGGGEARQSFALLINSENGINPWTEENFSYLGSNVKVQHIKPDSSILKPDMRGTYAVFKDLAPGDLIYVEGTRVLNDVFENGRTYGVGDYFSLRGGSMFINPIYYQKLEIAVPEGSPIQYQSFNAPDLKEKRLAEGFDFYRWEWRFTPELVEEDGAFRKWAAAPDIQFTNAQDWSWLVNWYDDLTRTKLEPNYYIQNLYGEIVKEGMQDEEIIRAIYNYITKEIKYSSVSFLQSNFIPQAPELTCSGGIGDCKDVATLMIALLRMADIESYYVLVRAGDYLPYQVLPSNIFNHAIVAYVLNGETYYLDLTTDKYPNYVLPEQDHGAWSLLIKPGEKEIFRLPYDRIDPIKNEIAYQISAKIAPGEGLTLDAKGAYKGIEGGRIREYLTSQKGKNVSAFLQEELGMYAFPGNIMENYAFNSLDTIDLPLKLDCEISVKDYGEELYGLIIFPIPFLEQLPVPDALLTPERRTVLDLNQILYVAPVSQELSMEIPAGYQLFSEPEDVHLETEFGTYHLTYVKDGNQMKVKKQRDFAMSHIFPEDYPAFRDFFFKVTKLERTKLILVKEGFTYPN